MANVEQLKSRAKQLEAKQSWRAAVTAWAEVLAIQESGRELDAHDLALYNRLGDLYLKLGDPATAADYFERAVERYAESGFHNNAIALCSKVLRYAPGRMHVYLKLAKLLARKGFTSEAKEHFLQYADRTRKAGHQDEAIAALRELTRLAPGAAEFTTLLDRYEAELGHPRQRTGEQPEPAAEPLPGSPGRGRGKSSSLVFLDVDDLPAPPSPTKLTSALPLIEPTPVDESVEPGSAPGEEVGLIGAEDLEIEPLDDVERLGGSALFEGDVEPLGGLQIHRADFDALVGEAEPMSLIVDLPPSAPEVAPEPLEGLEPTAQEEEQAPPGDQAPVDDDRAAAGDLLGGMQFVESLGAAEALVVEMPEAGEAAAAEAETAAIERDEPAPSPAASSDAGEAGLIDLDLEGPLWTAPLGLDELEARVLAHPDDPEARRALGESLIERGDRERGLEELEDALRRYEGAGSLLAAREVGAEVVRLEPNRVRVLQKLVELAYRSGDREWLVHAYLELGDALLRTGALPKAMAVYERVMEHDPQNQRARQALLMLHTADAERVGGVEPQPSGGEFVDLGAMVLGDEQRVRDTRMRVEHEAPTGDEERDFGDMLEQFRRGIHENLDEEDFEAHYDLGVAFQEMGLLDDAIAEFQKALRGPAVRLKAHEALGGAFFAKGQHAVAEAVLRRALDLPAAADDERVGILYWLGRALEQQGKGAEALALYRRVFAVDIRFADVEERVRTLSPAPGE